VAACAGGGRRGISPDSADALERSAPGDRARVGHKPDAWPARAPGAGLLAERLAPRAGLPPLLVPLGERPPEPLQWLGASFGLTQALFNFWSRAGYAPVYLRQTASDITGARGPRPRAP